MKRWIGFGFAMSLIIVVVGSFLFIAAGAEDRQHAREQAAIERSLAQERLIAQRQQYDQERWELTVIALTSWGDRIGGWLRDATPIALAIVLIVLLTKDRALTIGHFSTKEDIDGDDR